MIYLKGMYFCIHFRDLFEARLGDKDLEVKYMSHFSYACKTERQNGISCLISELLSTLNSSLRDRLFDITEWRFLKSLHTDLLVLCIIMCK